MAEPHNFSKHLRKIVGQPLKEFGFTQKGDWFSRESEYFTEEIYFQRIPFNVAGYPFKFFLILFSSHFCTRLFYPKKQLTALYPKRESGDSMSSIAALYTHFPGQHLGMSEEWQYNSEAELKKVLSMATTEITTKGLQYFLDILNILQNEIKYDSQEEMYSAVRDVGIKLRESYLTNGL